MFDDEWTLLSVNERFLDEFELKRPQRFLEWTIEYRDGNGDIRHFVFDNRLHLASQVERYVELYVAEYFKTNFFDIYLIDLPLAPSANLFAFMAKAYVNRHLEDNQEWVRATDEYRAQLGTPEGAINLSQLTPENAFEMMPIRLSISVSFYGAESLGRLFEEDVIGKIENMIKSMNRFTNNQLTANISMSYQQIINLHTGNRSYNWYYIRGERIFDIGLSLFSRYIFESFIGVFW